MSDGVLEILKGNSETAPAKKGALKIYNPYPTAVYLEILRQVNQKPGLFGWVLPETLGKATATDPDCPITQIETRVRGAKDFKKFMGVPGKPEENWEAGGKPLEFSVETQLKLNKHKYINEKVEQVLTAKFHEAKYEVLRIVMESGARKLMVSTPAGKFEIFLGFEDWKKYKDYKENQIDNYKIKYPALVPDAQRDLNKIIQYQEEQFILIGTENSYPGLAPIGQPLRSKEQVVACLAEEAKIAEMTAEVLLAELGGGRDYDSFELTWKPEKTQAALWHEQNRIATEEDLLKVPMEELSKSLVRVIQALDSKRDAPDLVGEMGIEDDAEKLLRIIEGYFNYRNQGKNIVPQELADKERVILALGLALKCADGVKADVNGSFEPKNEAEIAGVTFHLIGESRRNKLEFYMQQHRKFNYRLDTAEAADFFLLHTTLSGQEGEWTQYERIQSHNLEVAREWVQTKLEPIKNGKYTTDDVQQINRLLLNGLVPDRHLGSYRQDSGMIINRIGMTDPWSIDFNLSRLLNDAAGFINRARAGNVDREEIIRWLTESWACFDAIHPEEEGNGRTGTLLFESWLRLALQKEVRLESKRADGWRSSVAMNSALKGSSANNYYYKTGEPKRIPGEIEPLVEFVNGHLVEI